MSSKPKSKTFIHHRGKSQHCGYTVLGRYKVGARNEKEAEAILKQQVGKHCKVKVYYEEKVSKLSYGIVIKES